MKYLYILCIIATFPALAAMLLLFIFCMDAYTGNYSADSFAVRFFAGTLHAYNLSAIFFGAATFFLACMLSIFALLAAQYGGFMFKLQQFEKWRMNYLMATEKMVARKIMYIKKLEELEKSNT